MKYVKFTVTLRNGEKKEIAKGYKNSEKLPPCPHHWSLASSMTVAEITTEFIEQREKYKIWRRGLTGFEDLVRKVTEVN